MKIADMMDKKQTDKVKTIMRKAYEVYNEIDALIDAIKGYSDYEEVEELKSARDTACDVVDALQYIQENYGENDYR
ncbi:hypothetical protein [Prevotellamassilia timonensis]|uniref:hypothetical protein n=1 Tax=Prevotellamassilia timonensis TaxID=1852370 RepID=UPI0023F42A96|nr:hypothetical protein [Prevotellamassilia timonensis]MDD7440035.1 hypothetical protein [Prevotellamassilia timonensis]